MERKKIYRKIKPELLPLVKTSTNRTVTIQPETTTSAEVQTDNIDDYSSIFALTNDGYDDIIDMSTGGKISFPSEEILPEENTTLQTFPDYYDDGVDFSTETFSFPSEEEDSSDTTMKPNPNTNKSLDQGDYITWGCQA